MTREAGEPVARLPSDSSSQGASCQNYPRGRTPYRPTGQPSSWRLVNRTPNRGSRSPQRCPRYVRFTARRRHHSGSVDPATPHGDSGSSARHRVITFRVDPSSGRRGELGQAPRRGACGARPTGPCAPAARPSCGCDASQLRRWPSLVRSPSWSGGPGVRRYPMLRRQQQPSSAACVRSHCPFPVVYTTRAERVLRATATPDGSAVIGADPHSKFAAAVRANGADSSAPQRMAVSSCRRAPPASMRDPTPPAHPERSRVQQRRASASARER